VPTPQYVYPECGFFSPRRFLRFCLWVAVALLAVAGIGAVVMTPPGARLSDAAVASTGQMSAADTIPTSSPVGFVPVNRAASVNGTQVLVDNAFCVSGQPTDGNCVAFQLPKVRMVRVPRAASISQQGNSAKSGVAASRSPALDKGIAEPEKAQRSAHRRDQRSTQSRREARRGDWSARRYVSRDRGEYGRQGFGSQSFW
jgi:hypothetical protein